MPDSVVSVTVLQPESCSGCGLCCHGIGSPVLLYVAGTHSDAAHTFRPVGLPQHLLDEIEEQFGGLYRGQEPQECCIWFDPATRGCRHYEWRPEICREYEMGADYCLIERQRYLDQQAASPAG